MLAWLRILFSCSIYNRILDGPTCQITLFEVPWFINGHRLLKEPCFLMLDVLLNFFFELLIKFENWSFRLSLALASSSSRSGTGVTLLCSRPMWDTVLSLPLARRMKLLKVSSLSSEVLSEFAARPCCPFQARVVSTAGLAARHLILGSYPASLEATLVAFPWTFEHDEFLFHDAGWFEKCSMQGIWFLDKLG